MPLYSLVTFYNIWRWSKKDLQNQRKLVLKFYDPLKVLNINIRRLSPQIWKNTWLVCILIYILYLHYIFIYIKNKWKFIQDNYVLRKTEKEKITIEYKAFKVCFCICGLAIVLKQLFYINIYIYNFCKRQILTLHIFINFI